MGELRHRAVVVSVWGHNHFRPRDLKVTLAVILGSGCSISSGGVRGLTSACLSQAQRIQASWAMLWSPTLLPERSVSGPRRSPVPSCGPPVPSHDALLSSPLASSHPIPNPYHFIPSCDPIPSYTCPVLNPIIPSQFLPFPSLPFPSLPFPSLPFPSLPFGSWWRLEAFV